MISLKYGVTVRTEVRAADAIESERDTAGIGAGLEVKVEFEDSTVTTICQIDSWIDVVVFNAPIQGNVFPPFGRIFSSVVIRDAGQTILCLCTRCRRRSDELHPYR